MKVIVSLSGGMDSTTVLAKAFDNGRDIHAVSFTYGSKHNRYENQSAQRIASEYNVPLQIIDLTEVMKGFRSSLMLTGGELPEGHYEAESMRQTVVPGRNTIFSAILLGIAQSIDSHEIWLGIHQGDHHIYPDCRPNWFQAMNATIVQASEGKIGLIAPFLTTDKIGILKAGMDIGVPYHLTRTCYTNDPISCGRCGSCQERLAAFRAIGIEDPLEYRFRGELPKE